ncbi:MAG: alanine--tRNA ligase [bacterium]
MEASEIKKRYLEFFEKRGHKIIPSVSLLPENDSSSLFIMAGMQPLVPYLLGIKHPSGTKLVGIQKCIRTGDIEEVGDNRHLTFFEMLGNWSLGDYFKKEAIEWSLEFLTNKEEGLGLDPKRLYITIFKGLDNIPQDKDAIKYLKENFIKHNIIAKVAKENEIIKNDIKIIPLGEKDNFWIAGNIGPCGGCAEFFYDIIGEEKGEKLEGNFQELVKSGRIIEIWNNVFMEFNKIADNKYEKLLKPNIDTGMGLERTAVIMQGKKNVYETDIFTSLISKIKKQKTKIIDAKEKEEKKEIKVERIIADHIRSAVFIISDGIVPSNTEAGYVLRRILRRAIRFGKILGLKNENYLELVDIIEKQYGDIYKNIQINKNLIKNEIEKEIKKFSQTLEKGLKEFEKIILKIDKQKIFNISGNDAFILFSTYGFPIEITIEMAKEKNLKVDIKSFEEEMKKHQEISKVGSEQKFKGGLAGTGEKEIKYHTATHLLLAGLRKILGNEIIQKGSNITSERIRFDFNWSEKVSTEQLKKIENLVNQKITEKIPVEMLELSKNEAKKIVTILSFDLSKYGDIVKVYKIGDFSIEFCGGPHIKNTSELGHFKIIKEEAVSAGIRRIKAVLE